jgi:hypothetical protein
MMRDVLRTLGFGCILAGGILYFTTDSKQPSSPEVPQLQDEVGKLKSELAKTKEELAIAQTASSVEKPSNEVVENEDVDLNMPVVIIENGSNSTFVATSLESLGIIQDASAFAAYLTDNGLAGKIQIGEHRLDSSMDFKTIAKKITTQKQK